DQKGLADPCRVAPTIEQRHDAACGSLLEFLLDNAPLLLSKAERAELLPCSTWCRVTDGRVSSRRSSLAAFSACRSAAHSSDRTVRSKHTMTRTDVGHTMTSSSSAVLTPVCHAKWWCANAGKLERQSPVARTREVVALCGLSNTLRRPSCFSMVYAMLPR